MGFLRNAQEAGRNPKKYILTIILCILVIITGYMSVQKGRTRQTLDYASSLDELAVTVDGESLTLRDMAFYVAYEEMEVEKQAATYNPEDTNKYWNLHVDGEFIKLASKKYAIQMAVHDQIFYDMAQREDVKLTDSDYEYIKNNETDFLYDLADYDGLEKMGVTEEDICSAMEKAALAQKYQELYASMQGEDTASYDFSGDAYEKLLENNYKYKINDEIWDRVDFGDVVLDH